LKTVDARRFSQIETTVTTTIAPLTSSFSSASSIILACMAGVEFSKNGPLLRDVFIEWIKSKKVIEEELTGTQVRIERAPKRPRTD